MIREDIRAYVEGEIIPRYDCFDRAHDRRHVQTVVDESLRLAEHYDLYEDMVYVIAAFHDTGLCKGRELHHVYSAEILLADEFIGSRFGAEQMMVMSEAVHDHRASNSSEPRSIYGKIVAEADRVISTDVTLERTVQYGLKYYPQGDKEFHYERFKAHLQEKYALGGYVKLWIPYSDNARNLEQLRAVIADSELLRQKFETLFEVNL